MKSKIERKNKYESINGVRAIACFGIVLMHVKANLNYILNGFFINQIINEFTNFVFLFMIISSFGMCCGYFDKIKNNEISPEKFYSKRLLKILPFFLFLLVLNVIVEHSYSSIIEAFANSTLLFGFLQKDIEVLGVAWFLGLVFIFYLMFPFFTFLFSNKKRAWLTTLIALLMNLSCIYYFNVGRTNMFYSFIYFCLGGLLYLYKEKIIAFLKNKRIINLSVIIITTFLYFILPVSNKYLSTLRYIMIFLPLLTYAITYDSKILNNKFTNFIGNISLEIYLCHMVIFRIVEKFHISTLFSSSWLVYIFTSIIVLFGTIIVAFCFKYVCEKIERIVYSNENIVG